MLDIDDYLERTQTIINEVLPQKIQIKEGEIEEAVAKA